MKLAIWFWLFLVLSALGGAWFHWGAGQPNVPPYLVWANSLLLFILFVLLGWAVFGSPVAG